MPRRRLDADTKWRIMQHEAHRTLARKHYLAVVLGPYITRALLLAVVVAGLMAAWIYVPHPMLGVSAIVLAVVLAVGWMVWNGVHNDLQARQMRRARGQRVGAPVALRLAVAASVLLLAGTGWLALWSPYA